MCLGWPAAPATGLAPIVEGDRVRLTGQPHRPGLLDTFTCSSNGAMAETDTIDLSEGTDSFDLTHRYLQDGTFDIRVTVTDDDGDSDMDLTSVTVHNAAPQVELSLASVEINENGVASLSGSIQDAGVQDIHTSSSIGRMVARSKRLT